MAVDVLCIGRAAYDVSFLLPEYPLEDSKYEVEVIREAGGGPAANAAYLLALWGVPCAFGGLVGDDLYGRRIAEEFRAVGTDVSLLELRPGHTTPLSGIIVNRARGSRTILSKKIATARLALAARALARLEPKVLLFDGHELDASLAALREFPRARAILDAGSVRRGTLDLAGKVELLAASERFARDFARLPDLRTEERRRAALAALRAEFRTNVVVTLGAEGLVWDSGAGFNFLPARPVVAVDTTAAGDIFHGALAYGVLHDMALPAALELASVAAALSVQEEGGRQSIPARAAAEEALARGR